MVVFQPGHLAWLLVAVGLWYLTKSLLDLGAWFMPATVSVLALWPLASFVRTRRLEHFVGLCLLLSWAAYGWLGFVLPEGLPLAFFFVFLGLGFIAVYALATRPLMWPLLPAALLLGLGTFFWVLGMGLAHAPFLIPVALIAWGLWILSRQARGR